MVGHEKNLNMRRYLFFIAALYLWVSSVPALERPDVEFKIFQLPRNMMPRINGDLPDWACVPNDYAIGIDQLVIKSYLKTFSLYLSCFEG